MSEEQPSFTDGQGLTADILSRITPRDEQEQLLMDMAALGFACMEKLYSIPKGGCLTDIMAPHFHVAAYDTKWAMEKRAVAYMEREGGILKYMERKPLRSINAYWNDKGKLDE